MSEIKLPYLHIFSDRHGKQRVYFRYKSKRWRLPPTDSNEFASEYLRLRRNIVGDASKKIERHKDQLAWLIGSYRVSPEFRALKPRTKENYNRELDDLVQEHGDRSWKALQKRNVIEKIRDPLADTPGKADSRVKILSAVYRWAIDRDMIVSNPCKGVRMLYDRGEGYKTWTADQMLAFCKGATDLEYLIFALAFYTGQRRSDLAHMTWFQLQDDYLEVRQEKTDSRLFLWIHPQLGDALKLAKENRSGGTIIAKPNGEPYAPNSLSKIIASACGRMGLQGLSLHGLRKAHLTFIANAGGSTHMLQASGGHKSESEIKAYTMKADQRRLAKDGIAMLPDMPRTSSGKPSTKLATPVSAEKK